MTYLPLSAPLMPLTNSSDTLTSKSSSRRQRVATPMQLWLVNTPYNVTERRASLSFQKFTYITFKKRYNTINLSTKQVDSLTIHYDGDSKHDSHDLQSFVELINTSDKPLACKFVTKISSFIIG